MKTITDKMFYCKKQVRFLVSPVSWIHPDPNQKIYGSYLKLFNIEVKYPNARINSVFDKQTDVEIEIKNISI